MGKQLVLSEMLDESGHELGQILHEAFVLLLVLVVRNSEKLGDDLLEGLHSLEVGLKAEEILLGVVVHLHQE